MNHRLSTSAAAMLIVAACDGGQPSGPVPAQAIPDPLTIARSRAPHDALVCPPATCTGEADGTSPTYTATPEQLLAAWTEAVQAAPRTTVLGTDPARLLLLAQQRSAVFGFIDTITIRVLPAGSGASFAAHSRSEFGWWDFGVNSSRLERWQHAAEQRLKGL